MELRTYSPDDRSALYAVCLGTADAGDDASRLYADPELPGHVWLGPYLALQPALALVLDDGHGRPVGYAVAALDTVTFESACERTWWPPLRDRYIDPSGVDPENRTPDQRLAHRIHHPPSRAVSEALTTHPSHLHVDLLPEAQGGGHGRRLLDRLFAVLRDNGSRGVFLGVDPANTRAVGFYHHLGFTPLPSRPELLGLRL